MAIYTLNLPDGSCIPYQLERRPRRTVGMRISAGGLVVHAPKRLALTELEKMLLSKSGWIRSKLHSQQRNAVAPLVWQDNTALKLLGNTLLLRLKDDARNRAVQFNPSDYAPGTLLLALPLAQDTDAHTPDLSAKVQKKVLQWYRHYALEDFTRRLALFSTRLGVAIPALYLSSAKTRWGSCNSRKEVRLNWRLIQAPPHIINYVVCHELAHLKEMNHSAKFWAIVQTLYPDYKQAELDLKALSAELHAID